MPAKVKSKARDKADFWDRAYNPTVEIEYSDEEVARPRPTLLISGHLRTLRSRTSAATAEPTPQTTAQLLKEADKTAAKKNAKAKVAAAAKKPDQIVLCKKFGPCVKARVELETQGEPHICRCYDKKTPTSKIGFPRGDRTWTEKLTSAAHQGGCYKLAIDDRRLVIQRCVAHCSAGMPCVGTTQPHTRSVVGGDQIVRRGPVRKLLTITVKAAGAE